MSTDLDSLEATLSVFVVADVPAEVTQVLGGDFVLFRFGGESGRRVDLNVAYTQLERLGELVAEALRIREMADPPFCIYGVDAL